MTATWSSASSPASKAARVWGSSSKRRAIPTRAWARRLDVPVFHITHCSGERMPTPCQASVASTSVMRPTSRPVAALTKPHTSAISFSSRAASASRCATSSRSFIASHCIERVFETQAT